MTGSRHSGSEVLAELARTLSVGKLLANNPDLSTDELRSILEEAAGKSGETVRERHASPGKSSIKSKPEKPRPTGVWLANVDGASRGNPGLAGAGALLVGGGERLELREFLGQTTNNIAEYKAFIMALETALEHGAECIEVRSDSELMVRQMNGQYKVKAPNLKPLYDQARRLASRFRDIKIIHVDRSLNRDADRLANEAIDRKR